VADMALLPPPAVEAEREPINPEAPRARPGRTRVLARVVARPGAVAGLTSLMAGALTFWNAFGYPRLKEDEGQMAAQAWGILHGESHAALYSFRHLPGAPALLAGWDRFMAMLGHAVPGIAKLTTVQQGRLLLVLFAVIEAPLVYLIVRRFTRHDLVAFAAVVLLVLSPLELWYARWLEPDPFAAFWTVLALYFAMPPARGRGWFVPRVLLAGLFLGVAMFSKEVAAVTVPGFVVLCFAWPRGRRLIATGFFLLGAVVVPGGFLAWVWAHGELYGRSTSLMSQLLQQTARNHDGGVFNSASQFWTVHDGWYELQPFLILLTTAAALWLTVFASTRARRALGLMALGYWVLFASGWIVQDYYAASALPVWVVCAVVGAWDFLQRDFVQKRLWGLGPLARAGGVMTCAAVLMLAPAIPADAQAYGSGDAATETQLTLAARLLVPSQDAFVDDGYDSVDLQESTSLPGHRLPLSCNYFDMWCLSSPHLQTAYVVDDGLLRYLAGIDPGSYSHLLSLIGSGKLVWSAHDVAGGDLRVYQVHVGNGG
jgi:Dolichyl-phosphate-mannose-protein mannosyltransferase